jgi:CheY-like chemotaxis protein/signal transduction histidine kinase/CHASE3 domain sensor protein
MFKLSFRQQVVTGFTLSLIFVVISAVSSYLSVKSMEESIRWQSHTLKVISQAQAIETELLHSETGLRGFVITQKQSYLTPFSTFSVKILPSITELQLMVSDNPSQTKRVEKLERFAQEKIADMHAILLANQTSGKDSAVKKIATDKGKYYKDQMLQLGSEIIAQESILLKKRNLETQITSRNTVIVVLGSASIIFCLILFLSSYIKRTFREQQLTEDKIRESNLKLERLSEENEEKNWLLSGAAEVDEAMRGEQELETLSTNIITKICNYIEVPVGAFFLINKNDKDLKFKGGFAFIQDQGRDLQYGFGEGLIGQAALEQKSKLLTNVPQNYLRIASGLGTINPGFLYIMPILFEGKTIAVIELGLNLAPDDAQLLFLQTISESIGVAVDSAIARVKLRLLFDQTQQQTEELETQQEELRTTNEELVYKSDQLQASEEELRVQQEELRQTNSELEEKALQLEERNLSINQAKEAISLKAEELELSSKYKSEFLANMSHELRTPLNSILILARILKENKPENLNQDQVKYAGVIHNAGSDLLTLINDILDLSKIESGTIDLQIESVRPKEIIVNMESLFTEIARSKKIEFKTVLAPDLPKEFNTDLSRIEQIVKNLLSNAFKFTPEHGKITLEISVPPKDTVYFSDQVKDSTSELISISVKDSGIGISEDKQRLIFEAFQQADGSTSRKYGGTGLGLSISKELAFILGGEIQVISSPGQGSRFALYLPKDYDRKTQGSDALEENLANPVTLLKPELLTVSRPKEELTLLIVEDDEVFADVLKDYAKDNGFRPIVAHSGDKGLEMAELHLPNAIVLDVMLPVMDGWTILKRLKANPKTKHIPVHMMSAGEEKVDKAHLEGAIGFLKKPIDKDELDHAFKLLNDAYTRYNFKTVLIIEDQELQSRMVKEQLIQKGIEVVQAFNGQEALDQLKEKTFDCIILDLTLPDISGFDLLDQIKSQPLLAHTPVIINTAMELNQEKMAHIMRYTEAMVLKSNKSNDRLIDEVSLFMNKLKKEEASNPGRQKTILNEDASLEKALTNKTILITDDDMRNIFALSSALQAYDLNIVIATNGKEALAKLEKPEKIDLVLMDIMMPEMDGYEAMRAIRLNKKLAKMPIIALTAKAMKNDREKCIEAGANDYISKPVDVDKLMSMIRVWLS